MYLLMPSGNVTTLTDIALRNNAEENIEFPPISTVVIGLNEVKKGDHGHYEVPNMLLRVQQKLE